MDAIQEGNAQYEIFVETTENQFGRYLFNRPNTSMNNYIKLKENYEFSQTAEDTTIENVAATKYIDIYKKYIKTLKFCIAIICKINKIRL